VYSEVFDLKPTSELAQSWLKNPAHLSQIGFVLMVSAMVGMARCAVPARVVAGGTNIGAHWQSKELRRCTRRGHRSAMSLPR